jgi:hypothetical protein
LKVVKDYAYSQFVDKVYEQRETLSPPLRLGSPLQNWRQHCVYSRCIFYETRRICDDKFDGQHRNWCSGFRPNREMATLVGEKHQTGAIRQRARGVILRHSKERGNAIAHSRVPQSDTRRATRNQLKLRYRDRLFRSP